MSYNYLRIEDAPPVKIITLDAPRRRNALSLELIRELQTAVSNPGAARVLILASSGPAFSSGHDLTELQQPEAVAIFDACTELMLSLHSIPLPVIAEVGGIATAAGCQLVAACDLAVASEQASFATPGVRIGLFCSTPMVPLVRAIGRKRAMEMLLTGEPIDAQTALSWGLVNRVVPAAELRPCTMQLAQRISEASNVTLATGKRMFYQTIGDTEDIAYIAATAEMKRSSSSPEAGEGISAFLGRRQPVWPLPVND